MLCEKCKTNAANLHMTETVNGVTTEIHVCSACAAQMGLLGANGIFGFESFGMPIQGSTSGSCEGCGMSYKDYKATGRLGCPKCYEHFGSFIEPLLKKIHGSTRHLGKLPKSVAPEIKERRRVEELRAELNDAIAAEDYEKAAELRDKIRETEGGK